MGEIGRKSELEKGREKLIDRVRQIGLEKERAKDRERGGGGR